MELVAVAEPEKKGIPLWNIIQLFGTLHYFSPTLFQRDFSLSLYPDNYKANLTEKRKNNFTVFLGILLVRTQSWS
jgi:hypothetical protein